MKSESQKLLLKRFFLIFTSDSDDWANQYKSLVFESWIRRGIGALQWMLKGRLMIWMTLHTRYFDALATTYNVLQVNYYDLIEVCQCYVIFSTL